MDDNRWLPAAKQWLEIDQACLSSIEKLKAKPAQFFSAFHGLVAAIGKVHDSYSIRALLAEIKPAFQQVAEEHGQRLLRLADLEREKGTRDVQREAAESNVTGYLRKSATQARKGNYKAAYGMLFKSLVRLSDEPAKMSEILRDLAALEHKERRGK